MLYLLDTTIFSDLMDRHSKAERRLHSVPDGDQAVICTIVRGEVLFGVERLPEGKRKRQLEETSQELLAAIPCEPVPEAAGTAYASVKRRQERKGWPLDENDLRIAATALALGAQLVTRDSDLTRVEGLTTEDWTKP